MWIQISRLYNNVIFFTFFRFGKVALVYFYSTQVALISMFSMHQTLQLIL